MTHANVLQPDPEFGPEAKAQIEQLNAIFAMPEVAEPAPGELRLNRAGRVTGHLTLKKHMPDFTRYN